MKRLLVDGNALVCRLWWAHAHDVEQRFVNVVVSRATAVRELDPKVTIAWDSPPPTWRHEAFPAYKAHRGPKPEGLIAELRHCRRLPQLRHFQVPGWEADDIIATLAWQAPGVDVVAILGNDKDFAQLVGPRCHLVDPDGAVTDEREVERRWGVPPERMRLLISWMGDASDGLPGVRGVGKKRAIPHALAGEVGDELTYRLAGLELVPDELMVAAL